MTNRRIPLIYAGIWMIMAIIHILVLVGIYELPLLPAITEGVFFNLLFSLIGVGLWYMVRFSDLNRRSWQELVFVHLSGITVVLMIWIIPLNFLLQNLFADEEVYVAFLKGTMVVRVITGTGLYLAIVSIAYLMVNMQQLREQKLKETELQTLLRESELSMLRFQINPHFLFNSLNAISSLIVTRPLEANTMVIRLSDFMRYSLESSGKIMSTLGKELEHCSLYLEIERVRFGDRLRIRMEADASMAAIPVPAMLLQPLVENAVKHGLQDMEQGIEVSIHAAVDQNWLSLTIRNPFDDSDRKRPAGTGTGLRNIRARLGNIYGRDDLMIQRKEDGFFTVTINIPYDGQTDQMPDR